MRVFVATQGASLQLFHSLLQKLGSLIDVSALGYYVADWRSYTRFRGSVGESFKPHVLVAEWEVTRRGLRRFCSPKDVSAWEERLGVPSLWPAVVAA